MLEPQARTLLLDALKPPLEHSFDFGIGTSYSLDLLALLAVPLSLSLLDRTDRFGDVIANRATVIEAIKRAGPKFILFCQEDGIKVPPPDQRLLELLEHSIAPVQAPGTGSFHPKVWLLRYLGPDQSVLFRLVCSTRNLTYDRCWDTALVLEGRLLGRKNGLAANRPLSEFIAALPSLARRPLDSVHAAKVAQLGDECRRVEFVPPPGFDEYRFWPLGVPVRDTWPFDGRIDRMVAVSPFASEGCLQRLHSTANDLVLVSRADTLETLDRHILASLSQVKVFNDEQVLEEEPSPSEGTTSGTTDETLSVPSDTPMLSGLHAKLYVADSGTLGRVWTGSANATDAAFRQNVEFLVELIGKKRNCGCDALLATADGETRFASFLQDMPSGPAQPVPAEDHAADVQLRAAVRAICSAGLRMELTPDDLGSWSARIFADYPDRLSALRDTWISVWPFSLNRETHARKVELPVAASAPIAFFPAMEHQALTAFLAISIDVKEGIRWKIKEFVLLVPAAGMPDDRADRMLLDAIGSRSGFESYLRMMLSDLRQGDMSLEQVSVLSDSLERAADSRSRGEPDAPLFELLVRALAHAPDRIDDLVGPITSLLNSSNAESAPPPGFAAIWEAIIEARKSFFNETSAASE